MTNELERARQACTTVQSQLSGLNVILNAAIVELEGVKPTRNALDALEMLYFLDEPVERMIDKLVLAEEIIFEAEHAAKHEGRHYEAR